MLAKMNIKKMNHHFSRHIWTFTFIFMGYYVVFISNFIFYNAMLSVRFLLFACHLINYSL